MRVLKKQAISRRSFLKGSTVTALGLTVMGPTIFGKNNAWSATFKNISADDGATLVQMARDIYPHDHLADKYYDDPSLWWIIAQANGIRGFTSLYSKNFKGALRIPTEIADIVSEFESINR